MMMRTTYRLLPAVATLMLGACSVQRLAVNAVSDSLVSGGSLFESDDDPVLIGEALPLALKLIEALLAREPGDRPADRALLLAAARGYTLYAYVTVGLEEERVRLIDIDRSRALRQRARALYLRAHGFALRALSIEHPDLEQQLLESPEQAVALIGAERIAALYWSAATLGLAISSARNDPALLARLPEVESLLQRGLELDEGWDAGALHEFAISLAAATPGGARDTLAEHYARALALSKGRRASLYVAYAEAAALPDQNRSQFVMLLEQALAVDDDADPDHRLLNVIAQERARLLLQRVEELFL